MGNYGQMIRAARVAQNISQREFARRLKIAPANACRLEQGQNAPSLRTLERVAEALGISLGELLSAPIPPRCAPVREEHIGISNIRLEPIVDGPTFAELCPATQASVLKREAEYTDLEHRLAIPSTTIVQLVHPLDPSRGGAESAARFVRSSCDAGTSTLADLSSLLEFRNVRIHFEQLPSQVKSLAFFEPTHQIFSFLLRDEDTPERHTYRLAYELGTACLFASNGYKFLKGRALAHRFARDFAAAFLMPAESVRAAVAQTGLTPTHWSYRALLALKTRFNVSAEAFAIRLEELELISPGIRKKFRDTLRNYYKENPDAMEPSPSLKPLVRYARLEIMRETVFEENDAIHLKTRTGKQKRGNREVASLKQRF